MTLNTKTSWELLKYIWELEEENRKLKEEYDNFKKKVSDDMKEIVKYQLDNIGLFDKLEEENKKLKDIINKIVYLYKEEPTELGEYVKSWFKWWMSN